MKILLVGNGFDRKLGLTTDYPSFLAWLKESGSGVGKKFSACAKNIICNIISPEGQSRVEHFKSFPELAKHFSGNKFSIKNPARGNYFNESEESLLANNLLFTLQEIVEKNKGDKNEEPNIWYTFIQLLLFEKKHRLLKLDIEKYIPFLSDEGNWVDIEGLIQKNIELRIQSDYFNRGIFSVSRCFDVFSLANLLVMDISDTQQNPKEHIYELVWKDFLGFKKKLCGYLTFIENKNRDIWQRFNKASNDYKKITAESNIINLAEFEKVISFNYTNFLPESENIYYVHGNIDDLSNVVFGLDMNIRGGELSNVERKTNFEINLHKNKQLLRFSKISQLLHLQTDKPSNKLSKISSLSIIGHSIGEQDYSYYFSILDRNVDEMEINCFWYEYNEGGTNKKSLKDAIFEMLTSYERYSNQKVLHKMIFEGRLKLKKVYIPKVSNS